MSKLAYTKPEKLADLPKKYPRIFKDNWDDKRVKDNATKRGKEIDPEEIYFHFSCNEGWLNLLDHLLHQIRHNLKRYQEVKEIEARIRERGEEIPKWIPEYFEKNPHDPYDYFTICQIKEKFGGLRFYVDFNSTLDGEQAISDEIRHRIQGAIDLAESLSFSICEICGKPGSCSSPSGGQRIAEYNASLDLSWVDEDDNPHYYNAGGYFIQTLCKEHHKDKEEAIIKRHREGFEKRKQEYLKQKAKN